MIIIASLNFYLPASFRLGMYTKASPYRWFKVQRSDGAELQQVMFRDPVHEAITIVVDRANFASRLRLPHCGHSKSAHANTNSLETAHEND